MNISLTAQNGQERPGIADRVLALAYSCHAWPHPLLVCSSLLDFFARATRPSFKGEIPSWLNKETTNNNQGRKAAGQIRWPLH